MGNFEERREYKSKLQKVRSIENITAAFRTNSDERVRIDGAKWERENIDDYLRGIKRILETDFY